MKRYRRHPLQTIESGRRFFGAKAKYHMKRIYRSSMPCPAVKVNNRARGENHASGSGGSVLLALLFVRQHRHLSPANRKKRVCGPLTCWTDSVATSTRFTFSPRIVADRHKHTPSLCVTPLSRHVLSNRTRLEHILYPQGSCFPHLPR